MTWPPRGKTDSCLCRDEQHQPGAAFPIGDETSGKVVTEQFFGSLTWALLVGGFGTVRAIGPHVLA
jgi:hypothetical protein